METLAYEVEHNGTIRGLGCGTRRVIALPPGRTWITLINWATLEVLHVKINVWEALKRRQVEIDKKAVLNAMQDRLKYVKPTKAILEAMKFAGAKGKVLDMVKELTEEQQRHQSTVKEMLVVAPMERLVQLAHLNDVPVKECDTAGLLKMRVMNAFRVRLAKGLEIKMA